MADHETAADRIEVLGVQLLAGLVEDLEAEAVGVEGEQLAGLEDDVRGRVERDRTLAVQAQHAHAVRSHGAQHLRVVRRPDIGCADQAQAVRPAGARGEERQLLDDSPGAVADPQPVGAQGQPLPKGQRDPYRLPGGQIHGEGAAGDALAGRVQHVGAQRTGERPAEVVGHVGGKGRRPIVRHDQRPAVGRFHAQTGEGA